jgi:hypothetical protein
MLVSSGKEERKDTKKLVILYNTACLLYHFAFCIPIRKSSLTLHISQTIYLFMHISDTFQ